MTDDRPAFDHEGFFEAIDAARISRQTTWRQIANEAGISQSTLTRLAQGKKPDVESLAALVSWADLDANMFVAGRIGEAEPLSMISTYLRADKNLSDEAAEAIDRVVKATYEALRKRES